MGKIERICDLLDRAYGKQEFSPHNPPLDELVLTILSQNTTAGNCRQAFASLRERFVTWDDVRTADEGQIARAIYSGGLSQIKAVRIKAILGQIHEAQGSLDISWLGRVSSQEALDWLLSFYGVGPKTAACVLLFSLGRPVLPVDTHVHRVSKRLGLIGERVSAEEAHELLQRMFRTQTATHSEPVEECGGASFDKLRMREQEVLVPEERIYSFHINMVSHGREVCLARVPKCSVCVLIAECPYGQSALRGQG